jgi:hypothetical protein
MWLGVQPSSSAVLKPFAFIDHRNHVAQGELQKAVALPSSKYVWVTAASMSKATLPFMPSLLP